MGGGRGLLRKALEFISHITYEGPADGKGGGGGTSRKLSAVRLSIYLQQKKGPPL